MRRSSKKTPTLVKGLAWEWKEKKSKSKKSKLSPRRSSRAANLFKVPKKTKVLKKT